MIVVSCSLLLFFCRSVPVSRIWNNYQVLYVDKSVSEDYVLNMLEENGCKNVISLSEQRQPLVSPFTPVEPAADKNDYLTKRLGYFTDESKNYSLYYIPEIYENQTSKAVNYIAKNKKANIGLDSKAHFPWIVPLVCVSLYILFTCLSKNKKFYFILGLFSVLFSFSKPFYTNAASVILFLTCLLLCEKFWKRKSAFAILLRNAYTIVLMTSSILISFVSSWQSGFLFLISICSSLCCFMMYNKLVINKDKKNNFSYKLIIPAKMIPIMYAKSSKYLLTSAAFLTVLAIIFLSSSHLSTSNVTKGLSLPSPQKENAFDEKTILPSISDYYNWAWNTITFPYRNLNEKQFSSDKVQKGDYVSITEYSQTENGIKPSEKIVYEFNNSFMNTADKTVYNLEYPAIEKLMLAQERNEVVAYSQKGKSEPIGNSFKNLFLLFFSIGIPLLLYLYYSIVGRKRNI
ncbi:MAG: hypothetical protein WCQ67_00930 [Treponema sp.]